MEDKQDPNLSAAQESNTTKHINFMESEEPANSPNQPGGGDQPADEVKKEWEDLRKENNNE